MSRWYKRENLRYDLSAGLTVAIVGLPQAMAYALIAGVEPIYGLYTSIVTAIFASILGSSNLLVTGPTNAISLMIASNMRGMATDENFLLMLFLLTFLVGIFQLIFGLLRVGKLINYVSHSVIVGFMAGAGIIIALGQMDSFLGVSNIAHHMALGKFFLVLQNLGRINYMALVLGIFSIVIIVLCKRINRNIPGALLAIIFSAVFVVLFDLESQGVHLVGNVPRGLPPFRLLEFRWEWISLLWSGALAIAVVGLVEAIAISKSLAVASGQRIDANRDFLGQAFANIAGSFFQCIPASGSFTRSAINYESGARTKLSVVFSGVIVAIILLVFGSLARYIPRPSLAGVIIVVAYNMINKKAIAKIMRTNRQDGYVVAATLIATVLMPDLEWAIIMGVVVAILVHLWNTGEVKISILRPLAEGSYVELEYGQINLSVIDSPITILQIEGDLYFGAVSDLEEKLYKILNQMQSKVYILRLKRVNVADLSALEMIERFVRDCHKRGVQVVLCGVSSRMKHLLDQLNVTEFVGDGNLFLAEEVLHSSTKKAYDRAEQL